LTYRIAGVATASLSRLPSALFALGTGLWALLLARRLFGARAGLPALYLTLFSVQMLRAGHHAIPDTALAFAVGGGDLGARRRVPPAIAP